jgi:hypothetical protein
LEDVLPVFRVQEEYSALIFYSELGVLICSSRILLTTYTASYPMAQAKLNDVSSLQMAELHSRATDVIFVVDKVALVIFILLILHFLPITTSGI